jgi:hypothetical protein
MLRITPLYCYCYVYYNDVAVLSFIVREQSDLVQYNCFIIIIITAIKYIKHDCRRVYIFPVLFYGKQASVLTGASVVGRQRAVIGRARKLDVIGSVRWVTDK